MTRNNGFQNAIDGMKETHNTVVHHNNIYPKSIILFVSEDGDSERALWIDFDVAMTFSSSEPMNQQEQDFNLYEDRLVEGFGELLVWFIPATPPPGNDLLLARARLTIFSKRIIEQGLLPPHTKYY